MIYEDAAAMHVERDARRIRDMVSDSGFSVSVGFAYDPACGNVEALVKLADERMYADKNLFYQQSGCASGNRRRALPSKNEKNPRPALCQTGSQDVKNPCTLGKPRFLRLLGARNACAKTLRCQGFEALPQSPEGI